MKDFIKTSKTIILALVIVFGASYVYAWTGPTQVPTGGNTSTPINISNSAQYKNGALSIGGVFRAYSNAFFDGNVGIGTLSPSAKLEVVGGITKTTGGFVMETRTNDPASPAAGQMWFRTDI